MIVAIPEVSFPFYFTRGTLSSAHTDNFVLPKELQHGFMKNVSCFVSDFFHCISLRAFSSVDNA